MLLQENLDIRCMSSLIRRSAASSGSLPLQPTGHTSIPKRPQILSSIAGMDEFAAADRAEAGGERGEERERVPKDQRCLSFRKFRMRWCRLEDTRSFLGAFRNVSEPVEGLCQVVLKGRNLAPQTGSILQQTDTLSVGNCH